MNSFEQLCKLASIEKWCWNLNCTTCAQMHFRYGLLGIAQGQQPRDENWIVSKHTTPRQLTKRYPQLPIKFDLNDQLAILKICNESNLQTLVKSCSFPDWLGYMGLILNYMDVTTDGYKALSNNWASQLAELTDYPMNLADRLALAIQGEMPITKYLLISLYEYFRLSNFNVSRRVNYD